MLKAVALLSTLTLATYLAISFAPSYSAVQSDTSALWESWKQKNSKSYATPEEDSYRYSVFLENYKFVQEFNSRKKSARMTLNKFSDLTSDEFSVISGGLTEMPNETLAHAQKLSFDPVGIPASVDWQAAGGVTPVKNQGQCGSCWAFSTTGALETFNWQQTGNLVSFSEQQLVDCDSTCSGCNGGWPSTAMYYTAQYGIEPSSDYPYDGVQNNCGYNSGLVYWVNNGYGLVEAENSDALMAAIAGQPVSVVIQANQQVFQMYGGGIIMSSDGCGDSIDHAVLAVGYGNWDNVEAFKVKNSWGSDWGDQGYVFISTSSNTNGGNGVCGILYQPVVPVQTN